MTSSTHFSEGRLLVLASTSPFRRALLEKLGISFTTHAPMVDEQPLGEELPADLVARLAREKALAVAPHYPNGLIIGSDQVAVLNGQILGKPGNHARAVTQLLACSGRIVTFLTGLCLYDVQSQRQQLVVEPFTVHFRPLTVGQIERYLQREQPYQSAGSFKSEGLGIVLFEKLQGDDPNALIGLPLIRLITLLHNEGVEMLALP